VSWSKVPTDEPAPIWLERDAAFSSLRFDNTFVRELPGDPDRLRAVRGVRGACFSPILPIPVREPRLLAHAVEVARLLDLSEATCASKAFVQILAGNALLPGMEPYAACYGGHQFGTWAGQLGDGRVISLGEVVNGEGERWELQLKGAGATPYSRSADGRAVLRSSIREFLCSEAMAHLGIPTTRALGLVSTSEEVVRDMFYDGHARAEPGAIVCRVAPSFLRFGNFEIFAARGEIDILTRLADYTLRHHFPELGPPSPATYAAWLTEVGRRTARLMAQWMRVGFVHGVMNTDNLSILGLSIDYGPFGFLDHFDPSFTPNTTDADQRRYRFSNQPLVAKWNLVKLAEALYPLIGSVPPLEEALAVYTATYEAEAQRVGAAKLGLTVADKSLFDELTQVLALVETDFTLFFRRLADVPAELGPDAPAEALLAPLAEAYYGPDDLDDVSGDDHAGEGRSDGPTIQSIHAAHTAHAAHASDAAGPARARTLAWLRRYVARVKAEGTPDALRRERMNAVNPKVVLRNCLAQLAIDAAEAGDFSQVVELLDVLRHPYDEQPGRERYAAKRPNWARRRAGCSMLSCSS
jgi:serine/tyrosine/threonine adenylyltransferase